MAPVPSLLRLSLIGCCGLLVALPPLHAPAQDNARRLVEMQIKTAIDSACQLILSRVATEADGQAAIGTVALLKAGIKPNAPQIQAVCDRLCSRITNSNFAPQGHHVYEAGVSLLALANTDAKKYRPQIEVLAKYLIANQSANGHWHYPSAMEGDTSISQYAMLGLWEASRAGVVVPLEVWDKAANWHIRTQQRDGGFAYHPDTLGNAANGNSLHSMTAAGIGSLRIARRYLFPNARERVIVEAQSRKNRSGKRYGILEPVFRDDDANVLSEAEKAAQRNAKYVPLVKLAQLDEAVERGLAWMSANFTVDRPTGYPIYFLYGLERSATLAEVKNFGNRDWYAEGAAHLVATQTPNRSWNDASGEIPATAFGILFLTRATAKMVQAPTARTEIGAGILVGGRGLPDELSKSKLEDGKIRGNQKKSPLEDLLAQLENPQQPLLEATQAEIVEKVVIGKREELIGQEERLKKLVRHPDAEIRRTAYWALGRSADLRLAPLLIAGLRDPDVDVYVEARNALRCLSRQVEDFGSKEEPIDAASRQREQIKWRDWYKNARAYDERDDLTETGM